MSGIDGVGRHRPAAGFDPNATAGETKGASQARSPGGMGVFAEATSAMGLMSATSALGVHFSSPTAGMPEPSQAAGAVSAARLSAASAALDNSGIFSMLEVTQLVFQANKQTRQIQRNDMMASLDAQAEMTSKLADNMRSAAKIRFATAVTASVVSIAGSVAQIRASGNQAVAQGIGQGFSAVSGVITSAGEFAASGKDAENKLIEAAISRQEKQYQEAASMLGDAKENLQVARDTLRALNESSAMGRIAGNF